MTVRSAPRKGSTEFKVNKTFCFSATACAHRELPAQGWLGAGAAEARRPASPRPPRQEVVSERGAPLGCACAHEDTHPRAAPWGRGWGGLLSGLLGPRSEFQGCQRRSARTSRVKAAAFHVVCTCRVLRVGSWLTGRVACHVEAAGLASA